ncbi:MAG: LemA family protein, partial [Actinomycetota bacterium]|nr:LemA family protein [Actinomycetota bacterium]
MLPLIIIIVLLVLVLLYGVLQYNGLIRLRNVVQESWRQIDVELKRRHDLIPNLVETVKGYAAHERQTLEAVIAARTAAVAPGSSVAQQAVQENVLTQALGRLFAVAEAYPNLKANENFLALQNELTATEDRIAAGRRYYNANVRALNTKVESVPSNIVAGMFHITRAEYFEVDDQAERAVPSVSFGQSGAPAPAAPAAAAPAPTPAPVAPAPVASADLAPPLTPPAPPAPPAPPQPAVRREYKASYRVDPVFPRQAQRDGISGSVIAHVHVSP